MGNFQELDLERVQIVNKIATIDSLPELMGARQINEDAREALALSERDYADIKERLSSRYKNSCDETLREMDHECAKLEKEKQYGATLKTNLSNYDPSRRKTIVLGSMDGDIM